MTCAEYSFHFQISDTDDKTWVFYVHVSILNVTSHLLGFIVGVSMLHPNFLKKKKKKICNNKKQSCCYLEKGDLHIYFKQKEKCSERETQEMRRRGGMFATAWISFICRRQQEKFHLFHLNNLWTGDKWADVSIWVGKGQEKRASYPPSIL